MNIKTKFSIIIVIVAAIFYSSCDKSKSRLKNYYGAWNLEKYELYKENTGSGDYDLQLTYSASGDSVASYFMLYDFLDNTTNENLGFFKLNSNIPSKLAGLFVSTYFYWYVPSKDRLCFWDAGIPKYFIDVTSSKSKKMEWTFIDGSFKEIYRFTRADV
jgi:hypothetical protein